MNRIRLGISRLFYPNAGFLFHRYDHVRRRITDVQVQYQTLQSAAISGRLILSKSWKLPSPGSRWTHSKKRHFIAFYQLPWQPWIFPAGKCLLRSHTISKISKRPLTAETTDGKLLLKKKVIVEKKNSGTSHYNSFVHFPAMRPTCPSIPRHQRRSASTAI